MTEPERPKDPAAVSLGRRGGLAKSAAKTTAARKNAKKPRPRTPKPDARPP